MLWDFWLGGFGFRVYGLAFRVSGLGEFRVGILYSLIVNENTRNRSLIVRAPGVGSGFVVKADGISED